MTPALSEPTRDKRDAALDVARQRLACIRDHGKLTLIEVSPSWDIEQAYSRGARNAFGKLAEIADRALADIDELLK